jgi:GxxExxY protein
MGLIYEDRTNVLKRMFYEVQNEVGLGRQEEAYHQACVAWLKNENIPFKSKWPHPLMLGDHEAHSLHPDFVVWDSITVELKAVPRMTTAGELVQLFDYLKCRQDRVGFLVNMGLDRVVDQRVIYDQPLTNLEEDWTYWSGVIGGSSRDLGGAVCNALRLVYHHHQTGYGLEVMEKLIPRAIALQRLSVVAKPVTKAFFRGQIVDESPLDCLVVNNQILVTFTVLFDEVQFSINRGLSYMRALGLEWGIAVDFGKTTARITGLRQRINSKTA